MSSPGLKTKAEWQPVTDAGFDHDKFAIYVWRSVRDSGDTKTSKSRRTLELPDQAAKALKEHRSRQVHERLAAGPLWHDHGLVFASQTGRHLTTPTSAARSAITNEPGSARTGRRASCGTRSYRS